MRTLRKICTCLGFIMFFVAGSCMECAAPIVPGTIAVFGLLLAVCALDIPANAWR